MGRICTCYLVPHPPIIVKEIGRGDEKDAQKTINAMKEVALDIAAKKPDTLVVITPHGPLFKDAMAVGVQRRFSGDFGGFGQPGVALSFSGNTEMTFAVMEEAAGEGIPVMAIDEDTRSRYGLPPGLDHGTLVPLYFIEKEYKSYSLIHITYGLLSPEQLYRFGICIRKAAERHGGRTAIISSGDLSHRLTRGAPAGYSRRGAEYDKSIVALLGEMDIDGILDMDIRFIEEAGECAYRSIVTMLGTLDGFETDAKILSYEGPYGVGYCVALFSPREKSRDNGKENPKKAAENDSMKGQEEDPFVRLARLALESYVAKGEVIAPPEGLPEEMLSDRAGAFVTLKHKGQLRGCIGTVSATTEHIAREIINNAISAGVRDPRFFPVTAGELKHIKYSVDILRPPEAISSIEELDVHRYGVVVRSGRRSGLLLPDIEGVDTPKKQVDIALRKAGISPGEAYTLERFEVIRHQ